MSQIAENVAGVRERIAAAAKRAGRDPDSVRLIAVSKTFPAAKIVEAYECGLRDFGENRVQEFQEKLTQLRAPEARFHLIGHLQTNKVAAAIAFDCIHTIDSERLAQKLNDAAASVRKMMPVLLQVKLGDEESKTGASDAVLEALVKSFVNLPHLTLQGLMGVPPFTPDPEGARPYFRKLRLLRERLLASGYARVQELSMGMTHDFEVAIEEGATMVRIGTAIFGKRPPLPQMEQK